MRARVTVRWELDQALALAVEALCSQEILADLVPLADSLAAGERSVSGKTREFIISSI